MRALSAWPELEALSGLLLAQWPHSAKGVRRLVWPEHRIGLTLHIGDVRETLPDAVFAADAWFLDGFAPARNPGLWSPALLAEVARHTRENGTAATYTAAGAVRRGLEAAGFQVTRRAGFGRKRHMTTGRLP